MSLMLQYVTCVNCRKENTLPIETVVNASTVCDFCQTSLTVSQEVLEDIKRLYNQEEGWVEFQTTEPLVAISRAAEIGITSTRPEFEIDVESEPSTMTISSPRFMSPARGEFVNKPAGYTGWRPKNRRIAAPPEDAPSRVYDFDD